MSEVKTWTDDRMMEIALASCHSLAEIEGKLIGDPLDAKMFEYSEWKMREIGKETEVTK